MKGFAVGLLNFLLFLSIAALGLAFMLNATLLNPGFAISELDKVDIPTLVEEFVSEDTTQQELPEEFRITLVDTITKLEPQIKEQISATIYPVYDYLQGKSQSLDLALTLKNTILSEDFIVSIVDELDISSLVKAFLTEQIAEEIPADMELLVEYMDDAITEEWIEKQVSTAIAPTVDYLLGQSQSLNVVISLEPVIENIKDSVREDFLESPPPELAALPKAQLEQYFDEYFQEFAEMIPSTFEIDESMLGTEIPAQIAETLAVIEATLAQARQYVGYLQTAFRGLIALTIVLIAGIILIRREVRGSSRGIGITFTTYGAIWYGGIFAAKHFAEPQLAQLGIPTQLQEWLPQLLNDALVPLQMFSLGFLAAGIALIVVSHVYKPRQPSFESESPE